MSAREGWTGDELSVRYGRPSEAGRPVYPPWLRSPLEYSKIGRMLEVQPAANNEAGLTGGAGHALN